MLQRLEKESDVPASVLMPAALWPSLPPEYRKPFLTREEAFDLMNEARSMLFIADENTEELRKEIASLENVSPEKVERMLARVNVMQVSAHGILRNLLKALGKGALLN